MSYDKNVLFSISYGLYILSANSSNTDNACVINTLSQITSSPDTVCVTVNKKNFTNEIIKKSKKFNVSILSTDADFELIKRFGFQSGRDIDKFVGFKDMYRSQNGIYFINKGANSFISVDIDEIIDFDTHDMFVGHITDTAVLSDKESLTYSYYQDNIKPKQNDNKKTGYVCTVCGYIHESDTLPDDFVCPVCKHGTSAFVKL